MAYSFYFTFQVSIKSVHFSSTPLLSHTPSYQHLSNRGHILPVSESTKIPTPTRISKSTGFPEAEWFLFLNSNVLIPNSYLTTLRFLIPLRPVFSTCVPRSRRIFFFLAFYGCSPLFSHSTHHCYFVRSLSEDFFTCYSV